MNGDLQTRIQRWEILKLICLLLLTLFVASSTLAVLSARTNTALNDIGIGKTEITVKEELKGRKSKEVRLEAGTGEGCVPGVARLMIVPYIVDGNGNYIACDLGAFSAPVKNKMELGDVILEFAKDWNSKWIYGGDGYFYYGKILYPTTAGNANKTSVLLKNVSLSGEALEKYGDDAFVKIEVLADIIQAEGKASQEWGITVNLTGGTIAKP